MMSQPIRVGFVLHTMDVAGAEVLVAQTIRHLRSRIEPVILCLDGIGMLGEQMRAERVEVLAFNRQPGFDRRIIFDMAEAIQSRRLQIIHAHQYTPFFYGSLAGKLSRVRPRVIFTEHGRHYPDVVSSKRRLVNRLFLSRLADHVNAVCGFSAASLRERDGFTRQPVEIVENGIDIARYGRASDPGPVRTRLGLDTSRRYVATIARFHPVKDHRTLLTAFASVARDRPDVDLLLVGDGPLRAELEKRLTELGLRSRVRFMGVRSDVPEILGAVDLYALTSLSEAASITLLEAMASELPIVVTAVGGNPEILRDRVDGLLVPRGDAAATAAAILELLDNPCQAARFGRSAAERVRSGFRIESTVDRYYALYLRCVAALG
jgi:L-malate glycosyltransferase